MLKLVHDVEPYGHIRSHEAQRYEPISYAQPYRHIPYAQPYGHIPYSQPYGHTPYAQPYGPIPYGQPYGHTPYAQPYGPIPYGQPYGHIPSVRPREHISSVEVQPYETIPSVRPREPIRFVQPREYISSVEVQPYETIPSVRPREPIRFVQPREQISSTEVEPYEPNRSVQVQPYRPIRHVALKGSYSWEPIFNLDNSDNAAKILKQVEYQTSIFCSYKNMRRTLSSTEAKKLGYNRGGTHFEIISIRTVGNFSGEAKKLYESLSDRHEDIVVERTKKETYEVGPRSKLKLYRLVFNGPGINYETGTVSSTPYHVDDVRINVKLRQIYVLKDIDVVHTDDSVSRPKNLITEVHGQNPDINAGFGGKGVWLVASWTTDLAEGATGIQIAIQEQGNDDYKDLADGAGGTYRYLKVLHDPYSKKRIGEIALYRGHGAPVNKGWEYMTQDINQGRKGDYLYLCWNTVSH